MVESAPSPPLPTSLFRQIATRLAILMAIFAVLDVAIVVPMYAFDEQALAEDFIGRQARRIARARNTLPAPPVEGFNPAAVRAPFGVTEWGFVIVDGALNPVYRQNEGAVPGAASWPSLSTLDWTRRDSTKEGVRISGVRRLDGEAGTYWVLIHAHPAGSAAYWPVIGQELLEHVALPLLPLTLLLLVFSVQVVRRTLSPLEAAAAEVDALDPSRMEARLSTPSASREVYALVTAVNRALGRLQHAMTTLKSFTADAAHELRTPLSVLRLRIESLPEGASKTRLGEDVQAMTRLVNQMLDLAQADALRLDEAGEIDLYDLASTTVAQVAPHAFSSGHDIELVDQGGGRVHGHADALGRALRNLIENAIHHTSGGAPIEVIVGPGTRFAVRDHGPGLPIEDRDRIFDRFWRKSRSGPVGAGLGLGIVRSIVEAHGGSVEAGHAPGGGAIFTCTFPPRPSEGFRHEDPADIDQ